MMTGAPILCAMKGGVIGNGGNMPYYEQPTSLPVADHRGTADRHNESLFQLLHERYRILSFASGILERNVARSESEEATTLLWSHYADSFQGVCLMIDPLHINNGLEPGGFAVRYPPKRVGLLPSYYDNFLRRSRNGVSLEGVEFHENPESGILELPHARKDRERDQIIKFLTHKSPAWGYEKEIRMIYDLPSLIHSPDYRVQKFSCTKCKSAEKSSDQCGNLRLRDAIALPAKAILAVIFGTDTLPEFVTEILSILGDPEFSDVDLYWTSYESDGYTIQYNRSDKDYVTFMQRLRAKQIAKAKNHILHTEGGIKYRFFKKTENCVMNHEDCPAPD